MGRTGGCLRDAGCTEVSAIRYCLVSAVGLGDPFLPNEQGERGAKVTFQCTVETAAEFLNLSTRGPRCEARLTGHVRRRTGAEAFTVAGVEVPVALTFGHWGKTMIVRRGQEAPGGSSSQIVARLRRPAHSARPRA